MSNNWYQSLPTGGSGSGSREPLPAGKYNHRTQKTLHIFKLLEPKQVGDGKTTRHTFVVGSDQETGSAFLKIDLQDFWLRPEALALAFRKSDKRGHKEPISPEIMKQLDPTILQAVEKKIQVDAEGKVDAANTPDEARHDAVEKAISNTLLQIQINVGTIFRLCDWAGVDRDPLIDLGSFEAGEVVFEGEVKHSNLGGKINAEVSVAHKKAAVAPNGHADPKRSAATEFDPSKL